MADLRTDEFRCVAAKVDGEWEYSLPIDEALALKRARNAGRVRTVLRTDSRGTYMFAKLVGTS
jgi:hypothetical protein